MEKFQGKWAVVTGASSGVGSQIFKDFARNGINVIGLARRAEKIETFIEELGETSGKAIAIKCDISNQDSIKEAFNEIEERFGSIQILVNNAADGNNANFFDEGTEIEDKINSVIVVNLTGLSHITRKAFRLMKKSDDYACIININDVLARGQVLPFVGFSMNLYAPTKFAIRALSEVIRQELIVMGNEKIRITNLSLGAVDTGSTEAFFVNDQPAFLDGLQPLDMSDITQAIFFVLSTPYSVNITELTIRSLNEKF